MEKVLDGHNLTDPQMRGLVACFGEEGHVMIVSKCRLHEVGLSDDDVKDLVKKGYLESLTSGDYLIPASVDGNAIIRRLSKQSNEDTIRQKFSGMFYFKNT